VDRRIPETLSTSRGKPAGVSDANWIQTMPGKGCLPLSGMTEPHALSPTFPL
jgi:hypothetical protein